MRSGCSAERSQHMNAPSADNNNLHRFLGEEFQRVAKRGCDYLVLDELLALRLPRSTWPVAFSHLGVLYALDSDRDGRVTLHDLAALAEEARLYARQHAPHECQAQLQGACTLRLYWEAAKPQGTAAFVTWVCQLLREVAPTQRCAVSGRGIIEFFPREAVDTLHMLFNVNEMQGLDSQALLDLLQRAGEDSGLMYLDDEAFDELVPVETRPSEATPVSMA
ncbi:hypothetical protein WJX81_001823 [Elliptochloris bilobata]|uniref:EF-hand domain-containing protein n=1 Tax=Elliptochloris bilobata TaxID=381761 RepID=A0AAW1R4N1_9CHLO